MGACGSADNSNKAKPAHALTLIYLDIELLGDPIRLTLKLGNIPFTDDRFGMDKMGEYKAKTPNGAFPCLMVDGKPFAQGGSILRYCGWLADMVPRDPLHMFKIDQILEQVGDINRIIIPTFHWMMMPDRFGIEHLDEATRGEMVSKARKHMAGPDGQLTTFLKTLNDQVGEASCLLKGNKPNIGDVAVVVKLRHLKDHKIFPPLSDEIPETIFDGFPNLVALYEKFHKIDIVKKHYGIE